MATISLLLIFCHVDEYEWKYLAYLQIIITFHCSPSSRVYISQLPQHTSRDAHIPTASRSNSCGWFVHPEDHPNLSSSLRPRPQSSLPASQRTSHRVPTYICTFGMCILYSPSSCTHCIWALRLFYGIRNARALAKNEWHFDEWTAVITQHIAPHSVRGPIICRRTLIASVGWMMMMFFFFFWSAFRCCLVVALMHKLAAKCAYLTHTQQSQLKNRIRLWNAYLIRNSLSLLLCQNERVPAASHLKYTYTYVGRRILRLQISSTITANVVARICNSWKFSPLQPKKPLSTIWAHIKQMFSADISF